MGTRSNIGVQNEDGTIIGIYCHWDSYPSNHVPILTEHYATEDKARALVPPGDLSSLGESIGDKHDFDACPDGICNYYGRDRGEKGTEPRTYVSLADFDRRANYYAYLFRDGAWYGRKHGGKWAPAADMLRDAD